jgi:hypothetical protein
MTDVEYVVQYEWGRGKPIPLVPLGLFDLEGERRHDLVRIAAWG